MTMHIDRRAFLKKTAGGVALAGLTRAFPSIAYGGNSERLRVGVFFEPSFPSDDGMQFSPERIHALFEEFDVRLLTAAEIETKLTREQFDIFINPFGSAFPKSAYPVILQFLGNGGNWINLGGVPFAVPVVSASTGWRSEFRQTAYHEKIGITQSFRVDGTSVVSYIPNREMEEVDNLVDGLHPEEMFPLYVRLTTTKDFPNEDGSAGARDAVLSPLVHGLNSEKQAIAAPLIQIDQLQGPFAGGRWIFATMRGSLPDATIRSLARRAGSGSAELVARPGYACYYERETPSIGVQLRFPHREVMSVLKEECLIEISDEHRRVVERGKVRLRGSGPVADGMLIPGSSSFPPGFYSVRAMVRLDVPGLERPVTMEHRSGFWMMDGALLRGGASYSVDRRYLLRNGEPYPVTGTTYMTSDVHRKFLFEPNPYRWNHDFARMKDAGMNMVRTGLWTGWRNVMFDAGSADERVLRAMDAFVLTARRYDIPVIITLFAFLPELWNGENPYLDPRSVDAQKEFVGVFARRYAGVKGILWDIINEPSFCSPRQLWYCRPNYDEHERKAWQTWLGAEAVAKRQEDPASSAEERFGLTTGEATDLPPLEEFSDTIVFTGKHPSRVVEYRLFAQEMFRRWVATMRDIIAGGGSGARQLLTVGQDEGGTGDRPNPQFFSDVVDFSSVHTWWNNDDLLWDVIMTTVPGKPNLVEETGVMFYERLDGTPWRTEEEVSHLLERKLALSVGAGAAGYIQWLWNTNPYMLSDNEAAIGALRVDGTAKPEFEPLVSFAGFYARCAHLMKNREPDEVVIVIPHSNMFSVRNTSTEATKRSLRTLEYDCHIAVSAVSEYRLDALGNVPKLIIVPSPGSLRTEAWTALLGSAVRGSTLLITGPFDADEHALRRERLTSLGVRYETRPVASKETLKILDREYLFDYRGDALQKVAKAVVEGRPVPEVLTHSMGSGKLVWCPLPVELADSSSSCIPLYQYALGLAGVGPIIRPGREIPGLLVRTVAFKDSLLCTLVSESAQDAVMDLFVRGSGIKIPVTVEAQRATTMFIDRNSGEVLAQLGGTPSSTNREGKKNE